MIEQAATALSEFKSTRDSRRALLLAEYREFVQALAQDTSQQAERAERLDDVMLRLKIGDDELAQDIEDTKQYSRLSQSIAEFQGKQAQIDKQYKKWTKVIAKERADLDSVQRRMDEAQHKRNLSGQPYNRNRGELKRKLELESRNPRVFGALEG